MKCFVDPENMADNTIKRKRPNLTPEEKTMIKNVFDGLRDRDENVSVGDAILVCSELTKVSERSVRRVISNNKQPVELNQVAPEKRGRKKLILDEDVQYAIRRKIHSFYFKNELPTIKKIIGVVAEDDTLPKISRDVLLRTLRQMNFRFLKRNRKSLLVEKNEIVVWRRNYLEKIRQYRQEGRKIYYMDETWLNEGHTVQKVWQDLNIQSKRQAFLEGLSTGLKAPSGKGRRLIITHIGSETGFLDGGLEIFQSKKTNDYHEEMDAAHFEKWLSQILNKIEPGSVIVMDNAPYHSRRLEKLPTTSWRKGDIIKWLQEKQIPFEETMLKVQLLDIVKVHKPKFVKYVVDEMALERGVTILRLPPYHCELNPIELIWAQIKNEVARRNKTFKLNDVQELLQIAISNVLPQTWQNCLRHILKEEQRMWDLDIRVEITVEPIVINPNDSNTESDISDLDILSSGLSDCD